MSTELLAPRQLDFQEILAVIPQRFPFLMLDRIVELEPGVRARGLKNLTGNEWFYQGHFPKRAVTPGAMLCEAVAQTGIVLFHYSRAEDADFDVTYLMGQVRMRFLEPVWPGSQLHMEVSAVKLLSSAAMLEAQVFADGRLAAKGEFALSAKSNRAL